jgi:hypothetical protein
MGMILARNLDLGNLDKYEFADILGMSAAELEEGGEEPVFNSKHKEDE